MATPGTERRPVLLRLTSLRAFAALAVFVYHLGNDGILTKRPILDLGYTGVSFFFILSGFVLTWSYSPAISPRRFMRNRFARIYPATLVSTIVAVVVPISQFGVTAIGTGLSVVLLQAWDPHITAAFGGNGVTWSLSCEMAFYLALPIVLPLLRRWSSRRRWLFIGGWFLVASAFVVVVTLATTNLDLTYVAYCDPVVRFGEFLLGVGAALEVRSGRRMRRSLAAGLVVVPLIVLAVNRGFPVADVWAAPLFLAIIVMAAQRDLSRPRGALSSGWLVYIGEVSFCFYLVHNLVLIAAVQHIGDGLSVAVLSFPVACIAAVLLHHAVELPMQALIRGRQSAATSVATHAGAGAS